MVEGIRDAFPDLVESPPFGLEVPVGHDFVAKIAPGESEDHVQVMVGLHRRGEASACGFLAGTVFEAIAFVKGARAIAGYSLAP